MIRPSLPTFDAPARARPTALARLVLVSLLVVPPTGFMARAATSPAATGPVSATANAAPSKPIAPGAAAPAKIDGGGSSTADSTGAAKAPAEKPGVISAKEAQGLVTLGGSLTERNDFDAAEIAYRQVLQGNASEESTKQALLGLAHMHRKQGALTKATAIYERFLKDYPNDERVPDALLELGRTLRDMGAPRMAIAAFYNVINSTLKLPSGSGFKHYELLAKTAQFEIAETHFQSGEYAEATKFFLRLRMLDLAPQDRARAHFKAGYSLQLSGDLEGAVTTLRSFLEQWPEDENVPEARFLLATSLRQLKRSKEALTVTLELLNAERARSAADAKRWAYWQRRTGNQLANDFFETGDFTNALAIYQGLARLNEDPDWRMPVTYQVALCYERMGDSEHAIATYRSLVDGAGQNPSPVAADIARMAATRLAHVDWREATDRQIAELFDSTTGQTRAMPVAPKPASPHDDNRSSPTAPPAL